MSKFEDYDTVSKSYDDQRFPVGADVIVAMMQFHCRKPLKDIHVLDAGCGTGNYTKALLDYGIGSITMLDASAGMLEKAKVKLAAAIASGQVREVVHMSMPPLPFPDTSFDAVMFNMVLHHLDNPNLDDHQSFSNVNKCIQEARRVLKINGIMTITTVLPQTASRSVWFSQLHISLTERFNKCLPTTENFENMFASANFKCSNKLNFLGAEAFPSYYDIEGVLKESWRKGISYWDFAFDEEIEKVKEIVNALKERGELENWVLEHDHVNSAGWFTLFVATVK